MDCGGRMKSQTLCQVFFGSGKLTPTSLAIRHLRRHHLSVLVSKVRLKSVGRTGASRRAPSDVISRTRHLQTNEPLLGITRAGAEMRVRAIRRLSTIW